MRSENFELSEAMEKHMISLTHQAEKLHSELAKVQQRAMSAVVDAASAANPGRAYAIHQPGYGGNLLSDPHFVHQDAFDANYGFGGGRPIPPGPYDIQR